MSVKAYWWSPKVRLPRHGHCGRLNYLAVDVVRLNADDKDVDDDAAEIICRSEHCSISRDAAVLALADRVDAVYVRPRGTIAACLKHRLATRHDASTRVAVITARKSAARELIDAGAIGWYLNQGANTPSDQRLTDVPGPTHCR